MIQSAELSISVFLESDGIKLQDGLTRRNFVSSMRKREAENVAACRDRHVLDSIHHVTHR
jgi:hypothetical protein